DLCLDQKKTISLATECKVGRYGTWARIQPAVKEIVTSTATQCESLALSKSKFRESRITLRRLLCAYHSVKSELRVAESQSAMVVSNSAEVARALLVTFVIAAPQSNLTL